MEIGVGHRKVQETQSGARAFRPPALHELRRASRLSGVGQFTRRNDSIATECSKSAREGAGVTMLDELDVEAYRQRCRVDNRLCMFRLSDRHDFVPCRWKFTWICLERSRCDAEILYSFDVRSARTSARKKGLIAACSEQSIAEVAGGLAFALHASDGRLNCSYQVHHQCGALQRPSHGEGQFLGQRLGETAD